MSLSFATFVGIDIQSGRKPFTFIAVDPTGKLVSQGGGDGVDVLSYVAGQASALLAISMPWQAGKSAEGPGAPPLPALRLGGPRQPHLLGDDLSSDCPPWMSAGLTLLGKLQDLSCQAYPSPSGVLQWLEAPAESGFTALLGLPPFESDTLEGRIQRQLVLSDLDLGVPDAMEFFEEITRFKILHGHLAYQHVLPQNELNAWLAAATAWKAVQEPARAHQVGTVEEGLLFHLVKAAA